MKEWFGGYGSRYLGVSVGPPISRDEKKWTDWEKQFAWLPRKINDEWHWLKTVYCRRENVFWTSNKTEVEREYGTIVDVMTKPNPSVWEIDKAVNTQSPPVGSPIRHGRII